MAQKQDKSSKAMNIMDIARRCYGQLYILDDNLDNLRIGWAFLLSSKYVLTDAVNVLSHNRILDNIVLHIEVDGKKYQRVCEAKAFPNKIVNERYQRGKQQFSLLSLKQPILQYENSCPSPLALPISQEYQTSLENISLQLTNAKQNEKALRESHEKLSIQLDAQKLAKIQFQRQKEEYLLDKVKLNTIINDLKNELSKTIEKLNAKQLEDIKSLTLNIKNSILTNQLHISQGTIQKIRKTGKYSSLIYSLPLSNKNPFQCSCFTFRGKNSIIFGVLTEDLVSLPFSTSKKDESLSIRFVLDPQEDQWQIRSPSEGKSSFEAASLIQKGQSLQMKLSQSGKEIIFSIAGQMINISLGALVNKQLFPFIALFDQGSTIKVKYYE